MVLESTSRPMQLTSVCCCLIIAVQAQISGPRDGQVSWDKGGLSFCNPCLQRTKPPNPEWIKLQIMYLRITKFLHTQNIQMGYLGMILIINVNSSTSEWKLLWFALLCSVFTQKNSCYVKRNEDNIC